VRNEGLYDLYRSPDVRVVRGWAYSWNGKGKEWMLRKPFGTRLLGRQLDSKEIANVLEMGGTD
jgi:hypothetical protein